MPPPPGIRPSVTSGIPNCVLGLFTAMRWWPTSATSQPPPSAVPFRQLTTGLPRVSMVRKFFLMRSISTKTRLASSGFMRITPLRSAPAKKVLLAEARMMPRMASLSFATWAATASRSSCHCRHMVLTGEFSSSKVMTAMPSWTAYWMVLSFMSLDSRGFRCVQRWWRCPCRRPRTAWPGRSAACGGAVRRSGCSGSWRRWRPAGGPWQWRRR